MHALGMQRQDYKFEVKPDLYKTLSLNKKEFWRMLHLGDCYEMSPTLSGHRWGVRGSRGSSSSLQHAGSSSVGRLNHCRWLGTLGLEHLASRWPRVLAEVTLWLVRGRLHLDALCSPSEWTCGLSFAPDLLLSGNPHYYRLCSSPNLPGTG